MKLAWILLFVSFAAIAAGGCTTAPIYGSARGLAPVTYVDNAHRVDDCNMRRHFPQCSGGN